MSQELLEWAIQYIKHKDIVTRKIATISNEGVITYKDNSTGYIVDSFENIPPEASKVYVVLPNRTKSIDEVVEKWDILSANAKLCILFTRGEATGFWLLIPHAHHKISSGDLRSGLLSLQKNSA